MLIDEAPEKPKENQYREIKYFWNIWEQVVIIEYLRVNPEFCVNSLRNLQDDI